MPKLKNHSGATKRFKLKANGSAKRRRAYRNHILTKKTTKQKRKLRVSSRMVHDSDINSIHRLLPV